MHTLWFCLLTLMIIVYAILDGFDFGAGISLLIVAHTQQERRMVLRTIGPFWDGNEVWLIAGGGVLFFAFPKLYAASFGGLYLPLMMVLWLLILRGIAIEFRNHVNSLVWFPFWDAVFAGASALLAVLFGAAVGNVIRGVPLTNSEAITLPLWTDFGVRGSVGIFDWFTLAVGVASFLALAMHGALWVSLKTEGELSTRAARFANRIWWLVLASAVVVGALVPFVQPHVAERFNQVPWGFAFPALALLGLCGAKLWSRAPGNLKAFLSSSLYVGFMLASAAFGLYPYVFPSNVDPALGLTIYNSATSAYGLRLGLMWFIPGMVLVAAYFTFVYSHFRGKVAIDGEGY